MESQLLKIIREICDENGYVLKTYSDDFIIQLINNDKVMFIYGYKFPNNNASIEQICDDKAGLSSLLDYYKIPHVEHYYFYSKNENAENFDDVTWNKIYSIFNKNKKIVCKNNKGTGGREVYKVENEKELIATVKKLYKNDKSVCICPYCEIKNEYRIVIVNKKIEYIFKKIRPYVIGNGIDSLEKLINNKKMNIKQFKEEIDLSFIPNKEEKVYLNWKHNLGQGSEPVLVTDQKIIDELALIANECIGKLDLNFVSIDIIDDGMFKVLEINSGVMIEHFSKYSDQYYRISKNAINKAINKYFNN